MKNYSRQREEITQIIKDSFSHPTAEEIYMIAKGKDPAISRSTVYRNLELLVNEHIIQKIPMHVGADRYDYLREPHFHISCVKCGKIMDFNYSFDISKIRNDIFSQTNIHLITEGFSLNGICDDCKNKIN